MNHILNLKLLRLLTLTLACFALLPGAQAVSPPPDGDYPGGNTAEGFKALFNLSTEDGSFNTAVGFYSLFSNTTGSFNTAVGAGALDFNTGHNNTASGAAALLLNTAGSNNTALGVGALLQNNMADGNTAVGALALQSLVAGTADGGNTAVGALALQSLSGGGDNYNTAVGQGALQNATFGTNNTAVGALALKSQASNQDLNFNTAIGSGALQNATGSSNIAVGFAAGSDLTTGGANIDIGNAGVAAEANTIRIGTNGTQTDTYIAGISVATVTGTAVVVNGSGQLGVAPSSARFKDAIRPMDKASEAILALKPVTFRYKEQIDPKGTPQFGLVAEEVEKVNPALVAHDDQGKVYTVRYEAVNAMLLNEFLKARRQIDVQQKQIDALTAGLQKVSAQLATASPFDGGLEATKFATGRIRSGGAAPKLANNP
jgi:hypothetical protein